MFVVSEQDSAKRYWEMLSDCEDCYELAHNLWDEVQPLYQKLHTFVRTRLYKYYKIVETEANSTDYIPVYLLGK